MATWDTTLVIMLRNMIDDTVTPYTYSDNRIKEIILVGAQLLLGETSFDAAYVVDLNNQTITPDPTNKSPKDDIFITLLTLKSACIVDTALVRNKSKNAFKLTDDRSSIDTAAPGIFVGLQLMMSQGACGLYQEALLQYRATGIVGHAIMTPISVGFNHIYNGGIQCRM